MISLTSASNLSTAFRRMSMLIGLAVLLGLHGAQAFGGRAAGNGDEVIQGNNGQALPANLVDVGIEEHLGDSIPLDAVFLNEAGHEVTLGSYFQQGKPVLLNFAYFQCPMLCNMVLKGMLEGMKKMAWTPGKEFEVVTISIDSREGPDLAAAKKENHIAELNKAGAANGWHFLTGQDKQIRRVADAIGFKFQYLKKSNEFAHAAGIFTLSPQGKVSRYLYGIEYRSKDLKLALLDASEGKALSFGDKIEMFCYRYDPNAKSYVLFARNFMKGGGYVVVAILFLLLGGLWRKELRRKEPGQPLSVGTGA